MAHHVAKSVIQKTDTKGLANDPGVQVQYQQPTVLFAVPIQDVKTLLQALFLYPKTALYTICVYILLHQATLELHIAWMRQRL